MNIAVWSENENYSKEKARSLKIEQISIVDETLRELALTRAKSVQSELIKTHDITSNRLINCLPSIDKNVNAEPRVELLK